MGEQLTIPWIGTSGAAIDGDYAAAVILAGEGSAETGAVRYVPGEGFEVADGTVISLADALESLSK